MCWSPPRLRHHARLSSVLVVAAAVAAAVVIVPVPVLALPSQPGQEAAPWVSVRAAYNRIARNFAQSRRFPWSFVVDWLAAGPEGERLLVAGCGDGRHVDAALELGPNRFKKLWALDLSEGMLEAARLRLGAERVAGVSFLQSDICEVPLPDASCDAIVACAVLHHLPGSRSRQALEELTRVLAPGGRLLVSCWDPQARAVTKRGRPADGEDHAYWVAWRCEDGEDVDRWYHLTQLDERCALWRDLLGLIPLRSELIGDNQVFEWQRDRA